MKIRLFISLLFVSLTVLATSETVSKDSIETKLQSLINEAKNAQQKQEYTTAISLYEQVVAIVPPTGKEEKLSPFLSDALQQIMYCYIFDNKRDNAVRYFTRLDEEKDLWIVNHSPRDLGICRAYSLYEAAQPNKAVAIIDSVLLLPTEGRPDNQLYFDYGISSVIYNQVGQVWKAIDCNNKSIEILRRIENNSRIVFALGNLIWQYQRVGEFDKSLAAYEELLQTEAAKTNLYGLCAAEINIVELYSEWGLEDEVALHLRKAMEAARACGIPEAKLRTFTRAATNALIEKQTEQATILLDSMKACLPKDENNYYHLLYDRFQTVLALQTKGSQVARSASDQMEEIQSVPFDNFSIINLRLLGDGLADCDENALAIKAYRACTDYIEKNNLLSQQRHIYYALATLLSRTSKYRESSHYHELAHRAETQFTERRNAGLIQQFRVKYETRKKEQANQLLRTDVLLKERTIQYYTSALIALLLLGGIFTLWFYMRHRMLRLQHEADSKQHELDEVQLREKLLIIEEKERQLRQMLNDRTEMNRKNEELRNELERTDAQSNLQDIINSLSPRLLTTEEEQDFRRQFGTIHPAFLSRLREICPTITHSEELLSMLIRLNMTTEEIAFALGNNRASVHTSRSRLRKKLEMDKAISLEDFLRDI